MFCFPCKGTGEETLFGVAFEELERSSRAVERARGNAQPLRTLWITVWRTWPFFMLEEMTTWLETPL